MTCHLIDLSGWTRPAFEAAPPAYAPNGERIEVVKIVVGKLVRLLQDDAPDMLAFCADSPGPYWQSELWSGYKAGRQDPGPDYHTQHERIIEILRLHRIPVYRAPGFQADDCFAAAISAIRKWDGGFGAFTEIVMGTKDHDLWQLVGNNVYAFDGSKRIGVPEVCARYNMPPWLLGDLLALTGDKDEAPGVPGIGAKTAAKLLAKHLTLDGVLQNWDLEKGKLSENLRKHAETARLSRELVGLRADAPIDFDPAELRVGWGREEAARLRVMAIQLGIVAMAGVEAMPKRNR